MGPHDVNAATVLECLQREILLRDDIGHYCLNWGIPFSTQICRVPTSPTRHPTPFDSGLHVGLGWHPQDYEPDAVDYEAYETV